MLHVGFGTTLLIVILKQAFSHNMKKSMKINMKLEFWATETK